MSHLRAPDHQGEGGAPQAVADGSGSADRPRLTRHALRDRGSTPCFRAHSARPSGLTAAALRHSLASCSSRIRRPAMRTSRRLDHPAALPEPPSSVDGSLSRSWTTRASGSGESSAIVGPGRFLAACALDRVGANVMCDADSVSVRKHTGGSCLPCQATTTRRTPRRQLLKRSKMRTRRLQGPHPRARVPAVLSEPCPATSISKTQHPNQFEVRPPEHLR